MSTANPLIGQLFRQPFNQSLTDNGKVLTATAAGNAFRIFYLTNSTTLETPYQDAALQTPYTSQPIYANPNGQFSPIYLNPDLEYRSQLFDGNGRLLEDADTVNNNAAGALTTIGTARPSYKATTTSRTTAFAIADPDLSIYLPSPGTYEVVADLIFTASAAGASPGLQGGFFFSGTLSQNDTVYPLAVMGQYDATDMTTYSYEVDSLYPRAAGTLYNSLGTTALTNTVRVTGTFQTLTPGTFTFNWATQSASGTTSLLAGSAMTVTQVA